MDQVTRRGGAAPSVELCQRPSLLRRPQPLSGWNVPPLELAPPRIQDRWIVLGDPPQDKMPDADADDGEWLRNAVASFDVGLSAAAALRARVALLLSFSQRRYVDPLRSITWLAEAMLAARQPKEAGVMLDQVGSALSFDETLAVLRWESARLTGGSRTRQRSRRIAESPGLCRDGPRRAARGFMLHMRWLLLEQCARTISGKRAPSALTRRCADAVTSWSGSPRHQMTHNWPATRSPTRARDGAARQVGLPSLPPIRRWPLGGLRTCTSPQVPDGARPIWNVSALSSGSIWTFKPFANTRQPHRPPPLRLPADLGKRRAGPPQPDNVLAATRASQAPGNPEALPIPPPPLPRPPAQHPRARSGRMGRRPAPSPRSPGR
jgi:hypothetical protein